MNESKISFKAFRIILVRSWPPRVNYLMRLLLKIAGRFHQCLRLLLCLLPTSRVRRRCRRHSRRMWWWSSSRWGDRLLFKSQLPTKGATKVFVRIFWVLVTDRPEILREASKPLWEQILTPWFPPRHGGAFYHLSLKCESSRRDRDKRLTFKSRAYDSTSPSVYATFAILSNRR